MSELPIIRAGDPLLWEDTASKPTPGKIVACLLCTKPFVMPKYTGAPDQICPECAKTYSEAARLVCAKCKSTIGRVAPGVTESGYYIRPGSLLHTSACNICEPGLAVSKILEIDTWEKNERAKKVVVPVREVSSQRKSNN